MSHDNLGFTSSSDALDNKKWNSCTTGNQSNHDPKENRTNVYVLELEEKKKSVQEQQQYEEYDPYAHRNVEHPTTELETLLHLLKGSLGTGILAMPRAFYNSGYVLGLIATIIIGLLCTYCMRLLVTSQYELSKRKRVPSLTYPATAEAALNEGPLFLRRFSRSSIHITNTFLLIYQLGSCCVYVVFIASNLKKVSRTIILLYERLALYHYYEGLKFLLEYNDTYQNGNHPHG